MAIDINSPEQAKKNNKGKKQSKTGKAVGKKGGGGGN